MSMHRRDLLGLPLLAVRRAELYSFCYEGVMGSSMDLSVLARSESAAAAAENLALEELDRLCKILSTYDGGSMVSRLIDSAAWTQIPEELVTLLLAYQEWEVRSGRAISCFPALPCQSGRLELDLHGRRARVLGVDLNLDALGKSYVVDLVAKKVLSQVPGIDSLLLNVGGDISVRSRRPYDWQVGVAHPSQAADNLVPWASIRLRHAFVATSGGYARGASHLRDARSGATAVGPLSATVVAPDGITANALSTAICILGSTEGMALVRRSPGAECLIVDQSDVAHRSPGWSQIEVSTDPQFQHAQAAKGWGDKNEVSIVLKLKTFEGRRAKRPYVAVWAETEQGVVVKNIAVWIGPNRWWGDLYTWYRLHEGKDLNPITRATRQAGEYKLTWDGLGDNGKPVPAGNYRIIVEVNREHGNYAKQMGTLACGGDKASLLLKETAEYEAVQIEYGPKSVAA